MLGVILIYFFSNTDGRIWNEMHIYISLPPSPSPSSSLFPYHRRKHLSLNAAGNQQLLGECDIGITLVQGCLWLCHPQAEWFRQGTWHCHVSIFLSLKWGMLVVSVYGFVVWIKGVNTYILYRTIPGHSNLDNVTTTINIIIGMLPSVPWEAMMGECESYKLLLGR